MRLHFIPTIADGVLLSYHAQVHRDVGSETFCGKKIPPGRVAPVSHVQAVVFKLPLCGTCYPDHRHGHAVVAGTGRRAT